MTDVAINTARHFDGPPAERILFLMTAVMTGTLARYDLAMWHWAQSDDHARSVFDRVLRKRFEFAAWMFSEAGFSVQQAKIRGRMMVVYLMGESTLVPDSMGRSSESIRLKFQVLTAPEA